jgi:hypothetical protein
VHEGGAVIRRSAAVALMVVCLLGAGCGGSEEDKARKAGVEFVEAVAGRDAKGACKYMAPSLKRKLFGRLGDVVAETDDKCAKEMETVIGRLPAIEGPEATRTEVVRANATVDVAGEDPNGAPRRSTVTLRKSQKEWLVTSF